MVVDSNLHAGVSIVESVALFVADLFFSVVQEMLSLEEGKSIKVKSGNMKLMSYWQELPAHPEIRAAQRKEADNVLFELFLMDQMTC